MQDRSEDLGKVVDHLIEVVKLIDPHTRDSDVARGMGVTQAVLGRWRSGVIPSPESRQGILLYLSGILDELPKAWERLDRAHAEERGARPFAAKEAS